MLELQYLLFTKRAKVLAETLVNGICKDAEARLIDRLQVLDRAADALERVAAQEQSSLDSEVHSAVALRLSQVLLRQGLEPLTGDELASHIDLWRIKGSPAGLTAVPRQIAALSEQSRIVSRALSIVGERPELVVAVTPHAPWTAEFSHHPAANADIVVFVSQAGLDLPGLSGMPVMGALISGHENSQYLDWVHSYHGDLESFRGCLVKLLGPSAAIPGVAESLHNLAVAMQQANLAASALPMPERSGLSFQLGESGVAATVTWDDIIIPPEAQQALSRQRTPSLNSGTFHLGHEADKLASDELFADVMPADERPIEEEPTLRL